MSKSSDLPLSFCVFTTRSPFGSFPFAPSTNASQGFPNWNPPDFVVAAAQKALSDGFHQYTRTAGHPRLVQLLAKRYSKHFGREVDPFSQVNKAIYLFERHVYTYMCVVLLLHEGDG